MEDDNRCFFKTPSTSFSIFWVLREEKSINHVLPKRGRVGPFSTVIISISSVGVALVEVVRHVFVAYGEAVLMICFDSRLHARWIWEGSCLLVVSLRCFRVFCGVEDPGWADPSQSCCSLLLLRRVLVWWGWAHHHHIYLLQKQSCSCVSPHRVLLALSARFPSGRRPILSLNSTYPTRMGLAIITNRLALLFIVWYQSTFLGMNGSTIPSMSGWTGVAVKSLEWVLLTITALNANVWLSQRYPRGSLTSASSQLPSA